MFNINLTHQTSDSKIRHKLIEYVGQQYNKHPATIIEEFPICDGAARVDVAAVNGIMHGFEIKSDIDSLNRLPHQMELYSSVFDKVTLVVGATHLYDAFNIIPSWWGVIVAKIDRDGAISFNEIRRAQTNLKMEAESIVKLLWRKEAIEILEEKGFARGYKSKNREQINRKITEKVNVKDISYKVRTCILSNRQGWRVGV